MKTVIRQKSRDTRMRENSVAGSILWKIIERGGFLLVQFVVQVIMARSLTPNDYGVYSIMLVFTTFAQVFIQTGLTSSIIQADKIGDVEQSSVFWINLCAAIIIGVAMFFCAPLFEEYYKIQGFVTQFRVLLVILPLGAVSSIHLSLLTRRMQFSSIVISNLISVVMGGAIGILLAISGMGVWAIVWQSIATNLSVCMLYTLFVHWRPKLILSLKQTKKLISFGWKVLVSNIIASLYNDIVTLVIGKRFYMETLAYYNRGKQYPDLIVSTINESMKSVLLPAYSRHQDDKSYIRDMMRDFLSITIFLIAPLLLLLAVYANDIVMLMLTEKWLQCVPYLRIACVFSLTTPINTIITQSFGSVGRSDVLLQSCLLRHAVSIVFVVGALLTSESLISISYIWAMTGFVSIVINMVLVRKLFSYSMRDMLHDILPYVFGLLPMLLILFLIEMLPIHRYNRVILGFILSSGTYVLVLYLMNCRAYQIASAILRNLKKKTRNEGART